MKMRKKEVVKMLKEMQKTVYNSVMFEKAGPQQKWIIENLLGSAIAELDEYPYAIGLKNKNLIESKVVHPESEYDYVDRFDDDETDYLDYDCRYSLFEPNTKESKNISAKQECMKEGIVKKIPFLLTKEMIAVCINHSNTTYAKFIYEKTDDEKNYNQDQTLTDNYINEVKQAVYNNGSVLTLANWNYLYIKGNSMNSINSNARDNLNHAVVIVGWDDNYDKSNFLQKPKNNGAFLVRNSWGTNDHGYYWVSYEDKSIVPTYTIQDYEKTASNERIYNLEEGALCPTVTINKKTAGFVNIFSLKRKEQLDKISFYTFDVGAEYQIYYVPLDQDGNLDLNGMKAISESGTVNYEGYYTKQIKSPIIKQGKVAIMVVIKSSGKNTSMGAEGTYDAASAKYYVPSISKGESYLVTDYGSQDSYKENYGNWTIKLTTRNANDKSVTQDNKIQNIKKEITEKDLGLHSISDLELDAGNVVYNGKSKNPNTIVTTDNDELLDLNDDYYAVYKNNKNIGLATVTIKGKSFFVGSKTKKFWIHPDKVKSLKVKQKRNITTIRFRKNKGGVTGYRIKYSTRRDMKHCKYIMTKKNVCKIKNRHKLYVRVKAYKQVGTKKVYSVKWAK